MNHFKGTIYIILCCVLVFGIMPIGQAVAEETDPLPKIRIVSSADHVKVGDRFEVAIWLQGFTGKYSEIGTLQVRLKYDNDLIKPIGDKAGYFDPYAIFPKASNPADPLVNVVDKNGKVEFAQFTMRDTAIGGYTKIGTVTFEAVKDGQALIEQEKTIVTKPSDDAGAIKLEYNNITIAIGANAVVKEKIETTKGTAKLTKKERTQDEILKGFKDFNSIAKLDWSMTGIAKLADRKIVNGTPDGNFNPTLNMTRAEFAKVIVLALDLNMVQQMNPTFSDIKKTDWFYDYVETAAHYGLINGIEKNGVRSYNPAGNISREEIATILSRALTKVKGKSIGTNLTNPFTDVIETHWSKKEILHLYSLNVIKGKSSTEFKPADKASRAEVAVMLDRMLNLK